MNRIIKLQQEKNKLHIKILKLKKFLESDEVFDGHQAHKLMLGGQLAAMNKYYGFLNQRIYHLETLGTSHYECVRDLISDEEIEKVHGDANFGGMEKRDVVRQGVLKCASGYHQGSTSESILAQHGLINGNYWLTPKGREYLWLSFRGELSV